MNYKSKTRKRGKYKKLVKTRKYRKILKYSKKRRGTYKHRNKTQHLRKKRTTLERRHSRRKMYGGEQCQDQVDTVDKAKSAIASFPNEFKTFFDILEDCPEIIPYVSDEYKQKIELKNDKGESTGYLGLLGLQLINYLHFRITKHRTQRDKLEKYLKNYEHLMQENMKVEKYQELEKIKTKIDRLKQAISLMDQVAAAPAITEVQVSDIKKRVDKKYYDRYIELYNELAEEFELKKRKKRDDPLSTSACYFSQNCDSEGEVCDDSCVPESNEDNEHPTKRQKT